MEKKKITKNLYEKLDVYEKIDEELSYGERGIDIRDMIIFLNKAKDKGANFIVVDVSSDWDGDVDNVTLNPVILREETDEEFDARENYEEIKRLTYQQRVLHDEKELYKKLKQKFESNEST